MHQKKSIIKCIKKNLYLKIICIQKNFCPSSNRIFPLLYGVLVRIFDFSINEYRNVIVKLSKEKLIVQK